MALAMVAFCRNPPTRRGLLAGAGAFSAAYLAGRIPAAAEQASAWSESSHSALRLIDGGPGPGGSGQHRAAIAIRLKPGFKTYWRHPGDSGVPPQFSFDDSANLREAIVHFPAPRRFDDGAGGVSFGYQDNELLLPLTVSPLEPGRPVMLRLKAEYAVCEKLCVLASGTAEVQLAGAPTAHGDEVRAAMQKVPTPVALGAPGPVRILGLRRGAAAASIVVDIEAPDGSAPELFIEAPQPWFFDVEAMTAGRPGAITAKIVEHPTPTIDTTLTLTLVSNAGAIEVRAPLDSTLIAP